MCLCPGGLRDLIWALARPRVDVMPFKLSLSGKVRDALVLYMFWIPQPKAPMALLHHVSDEEFQSRSLPSGTREYSPRFVSLFGASALSGTLCMLFCRCFEWPRHLLALADRLEVLMMHPAGLEVNSGLIFWDYVIYRHALITLGCRYVLTRVVLYPTKCRYSVVNNSNTCYWRLNQKLIPLTEGFKNGLHLLPV